MNDPQTWMEVIVTCDAGVVGAVENFFFEQGSCGLEEGDGCVKAYFDRAISQARLKSALNIFLDSLKAMGHTVGQTDVTIIPHEDWNARWRSHFKPVAVTERVIVKPPWENWEKAAGQIVVDIMPRMAFGTGTHETTQLCLELLEAFIRPNDAILDMGTGSGVLAIAASELGAGRVVGVELDAVAVENARENVSMNHVENAVEIRHGSSEAVGEDVFDVILANINRTVLVEMLPALKHRLNLNGWMILSGILKSEGSSMRAALEDTGIDIREMKQRGEWLGMVCKVLT